jgi:histidine triad (HIT) family protein
MIERDNSMSESSIFTKIINGDIPADIVYQDDVVVAFRDINPQAPIHILVVPREPIVKISDLTEENADIPTHLLLAAGKIARQEGFVDKGFRLVLNEGQDGGQDVMHIHMHIMSGRQMGWPPG